MKFFFIYLVFALLLLIIESTILHFLLPALLVPDVILIIVFYLGFYKVTIQGVVTTFILGYLTDVFSGGVIGLSSSTLLLVFVITTRLSRIVSLNSTLVKAAGATFMSIFKGITTYLFLSFLNQEIPFYIIFPIAISTGIVSPFIIAILQKAELYFANHRGEDRIRQ